MPKIKSINPRWGEALVQDNREIQELPRSFFGRPTTEIETVDSVDALKLDLEQKQAEAAEGRKLEQLAAGDATHAVQFAMGIPQPDIRARLLAKASKACHNSEGASLLLTEALHTVNQIPTGPEQMAAIMEIAEAAAFTKNRPITQSSVQTGLLVGAEAYREDAQAHPTTPVYKLENFRL